MVTFYNVGTALFTVEKIGELYFVYDCGFSRRKDAGNIIGKAFSPGTEIEAVFISHYDRDHINGIHELLRYCKVRRLILPMLPDYLKWYYITQRLNPQDRFFIANPIGYIRNLKLDTIVCFVEKVNIEDDLGGRSSREYRNWKDLKNGECFHSGINLVITPKFMPEWVLIPWNIVELNANDEKAFLKRCGLDAECRIEDLWYKKNIYKDVKRAMNNASVNATSMTLYSGPRDVFRFPMSSCRFGCLFLGDFDAKKNLNKLKWAYWPEWTSIGCVQSPHHGSNNNFNIDLLNEEVEAVISCRLNYGKVNPKDVIKTLNSRKYKYHITDPENVCFSIEEKIIKTYQKEVCIKMSKLSCWM